MVQVSHGAAQHSIDHTPILRSKSLAFYAGLAGIAALFVVYVRTAWITDDALITLRSVLNFVHGYGPVHHINERVQAFTHTSWFFVLSAITLLVKNPFYATVVSSFLANSITLILLFKNVRASYLIFATFLFSKAYIDFANSGLENPLSFLVISIIILSSIKAEACEQTSKRYLHQGMLFSALILTRPDHGLYLITFAAAYLGRNNWKHFAIGLIPLFLWEAFSLFYYGSLIPNSAVAKLNGKPELHYTVVQGVHYLLDSANRDPLTLFTVFFFTILSWCRRELLWLSSANILSIFYVISVGGDFMSGRFLTLPFFTSAVGVTILLKKDLSKLKTIVILILIPLIGQKAIHGNLLAGAHYTNAEISPQGIADERGFYFQDYGLLPILAGNKAWLTLPNWQKDASLPYPYTAYVTCGQLGKVGLEAGPMQHVIDACGLSDPLLARLPAALMSTKGIDEAPALYRFDDPKRPGHYTRHIPPGYIKVVRGSSETLLEPYAEALYSDVKKTVREPLLAEGRLKAILNLHLKNYEAEHVYRSATRPDPTPTYRKIDLSEIPTTVPVPPLWNHAQNLILERNETLDVGIEQRLKGIEISVDNNDVYRVVLFDDKNSRLADIELTPQNMPGMFPRTIEFSEAQFISHMSITPITGDSLYSLGHLKFKF